MGSRASLLHLDAVSAEVFSREFGVRNSQHEVSGASRVSLRLLKQVKRLAPAEVEPQRHKVERLRLGDFRQAENVAVKPSGIRQVR